MDKKWTNVRLSTSFDVDLEISCGDSSPAFRDRASMHYAESWASATIHLELGQSHPGALTMVQLWDWTPRPTCTHLLHDVAAKPAVLSTPVNDQVLIYTFESGEASVGEFLAQGNCDSVASTRIEPSTLITEYKISDVITNAVSSALPPRPPHTHTWCPQQQQQQQQQQHRPVHTHTNTYTQQQRRRRPQQQL